MGYRRTPVFGVMAQVNLVVSDQAGRAVQIYWGQHHNCADGVMIVQINRNVRTPTRLAAPGCRVRAVDGIPAAGLATAARKIPIFTSDAVRLVRWRLILE